MQGRERPRDAACPHIASCLTRYVGRSTPRFLVKAPIRVRLESPPVERKHKRRIGRWSRARHDTTRRAKSPSLESTRLTFGGPPFNLSYPSNCRSPNGAGSLLLEPLQSCKVCFYVSGGSGNHGKRPLWSTNSRCSLHACSPRTRASG